MSARQFVPQCGNNSQSGNSSANWTIRVSDYQSQTEDDSVIADESERRRSWLPSSVVSLLVSKGLLLTLVK